MTDLASGKARVATAVAEIAEDIEAFAGSEGEDCEAYHIELAEEFGLKVDVIKARWAEARRVVAGRKVIAPAPAPFNRRSAELAALVAKEAEEAKRFTEALEKAVAKPEPVVAAAKVEPAPAIEVEPGPVAEPQPKPAPTRPAEAGVVVDMDAPYEVARRFLLNRYSLDGVPTLRWWCGEWRKWIGTHYGETEEDALRAELYDFLAKANEGKFDPKPKHVNELIDAIKARVMLDAEVEVGTWLGDGNAPWGASAIICCKNGVVRLSDGRLWPHDPKLFALNAIETEYRPGAVAPRWERFLDELWAGDGDTCDALQEFFGLALTDETRFQKGFILVGPARSGKGTIARVLRNLLGKNNYCGPSLGQLAQQFGMQGLIGKKLAVVPDARLDNRANRSVITEKLLSIIGEDPQDINRKNKSYWSGILHLRVMILSNELPDFKDDTGVIATRFIILQTLVSFLGREDTELESKLCGELSGILNWALVGWQRLVERGKFKPPGNGELNDELASIASSIKAFVAERCELGKEHSAPIDTVFVAYRDWCQSNGGGWADRLPVNQFSGKLRSAFHGQVETIRPRAGNASRKRMFAGIRLRRSRLQ